MLRPVSSVGVQCNDSDSDLFLQWRFVYEERSRGRGGERKASSGNLFLPWLFDLREEKEGKEGKDGK
jgi:hypothetical protein